MSEKMHGLLASMSNELKVCHLRNPELQNVVLYYIHMYTQIFDMNYITVKLYKSYRYYITI